MPGSSSILLTVAGSPILGGPLEARAELRPPPTLSLGLCTLTAVSWYATLVTQEFFNPSTPVNAR